MTFYALKCALLPDLPNNDGMFRPIQVVAPERTLLNPVFPAAVGARVRLGPLRPGADLRRAVWAVARPGHGGAGLAAVEPDVNWARMAARSRGSPPSCSSTAGWGRGRTGTASPACPGRAISPVTPVEIAERNAPIIFEHKRLAPGSGGEGRQRGGLGQEVLITLDAADGASAHFMVERTRFGAPGLEGGGSGAPGAVRINGVEVEARVPQHLRPGDRIALTTPGGGGYGDPAAREDAAIHRDTTMGYV